MIDDFWNKPWSGTWKNHAYDRRISQQTAVGIALKQVPGEVVNVDLELENGILVYEVFILMPSGLYEVKINADTGEVVEIEADND